MDFFPGSGTWEGGTQRTSQDRPEAPTLLKVWAPPRGLGSGSLDIPKSVPKQTNRLPVGMSE